MGWLFGKKKVPKVPFPEGQIVDETALRFPGGSSSERVIEPEQLKEAAGFKEQRMPSFPAMDGEMEETEAPRKTMGLFRRETSPFVQNSEPLFVKMEVYQRILGEMDELRLTLTKLSEINKHLESSEYNEENNFETLRREVKLAHDRLLQVDNVLFKSEKD